VRRPTPPPLLHTLDRRALLGWLGRASAGAAGLALLGCGDRDGDGGLGADASGDGGGGCRITTSDVLGPYFRDGAPSRSMIAAATEPGERLVLDGVVLAEDCSTPLAGAVLEVWQADRDGVYYEPDAPGGPYRLRGRVTTAADGTWQVDTIRPGNYMLDAVSWRPAHVHFMVMHPGYDTLTTQLYFAGDRFLPPHDGCTTCGSDDPARIISLAGGTGGGWRGQFPIVLDPARPGPLPRSRPT